MMEVEHSRCVHAILFAECDHNNTKYFVVSEIQDTHTVSRLS